MDQGMGMAAFSGRAGQGYGENCRFRSSQRDYPLIFL